MTTGDPLPTTFVPRHVPPGRRTAVLLLTCADARGIVAAVADFLSRHGANIVEVDQHTDHDDGLFFQRVEFELDGLRPRPDEVLAGLPRGERRFGMECELRLPERRRRASPCWPPGSRTACWTCSAR